MPFEKGSSGNPNGRPKGIKNERTEQWESLAEAITGKLAERFEKEVEALEGKDFLQMYIQVLNYFKPKYQSTELKADNNNKITVVYESEPIQTASGAGEDQE